MPDIGNRYGREFTLTQLTYALATRDRGSFSAAARQCRVSQPALSSGIASLEQTLGLALFERTATGARPTPGGVHLLVSIEEILSCADGLFAAAERLANRRQGIRLGVSPLVSPTLIAEAFDAFRSLPEDVEVAFSEANLGQLQSDLAGRQLDLILVPRVEGEDDSSIRRVIFTEPLLHVTNKSTPTGPTLDVEELNEATLVLVTEECGLTEVVRTALSSAGVAPDTHKARATSYQRLLEWADLGLGDAILPASRVPPAQAASLLYAAGQSVTISYEAVWAADSPKTELIKSAIDFIVAESDPSA